MKIFNFGVSMKRKRSESGVSKTTQNQQKRDLEFSRSSSLESQEEVEAKIKEYV